MIRIRPLVFWIFVGVFFVTACLVVFYAFGYRFSPERGIFIYTGSISIKSTPEAVDIVVDGTPIPKSRLGILNNSILIPGLTPGEHLIEVTAPDYLPWSKKALVQSGISTEFWNIILVKKTEIPKSIPNIDAVTKIFPAPDQNLLAVARNKDGVFMVDVLNTTTGTTDMVFSLSDATLPSNEENIEWSPDNKQLIVPTETSQKRSYSVVDIQNRKSTLLSPPESDSEMIRNPRWDSTTRGIIFYVIGTTLYRADTKTPETSPVFVKDHVAAYDISGDSIYYLNDSNGIIYRIPGNRPETDPLQITTVPLDMNHRELYSLVVYDESRIAVRENGSGRLFIYNRLSASETIFRQIATSGVKGIQFSDDGKKLLFFTDNEISVYFVRDWNAQPMRERDSILQIARFSSTLRNVQWTEDYEHVVFTLNGNVTMAELDHRDRRNMTEIAVFPETLTQVLSRFGENRLYFVSRAGALSYTSFPTEQTNFLGF